MRENFKGGMKQYRNALARKMPIMPILPTANMKEAPSFLINSREDSFINFSSKIKILVYGKRKSGLFLNQSL